MVSGTPHASSCARTAKWIRQRPGASRSEAAIRVVFLRSCIGAVRIHMTSSLPRPILSVVRRVIHQRRRTSAKTAVKGAGRESGSVAT